MPIDKRILNRIDYYRHFQQEDYYCENQSEVTIGERYRLRRIRPIYHRGRCSSAAVQASRGASCNIGGGEGRGGAIIQKICQICTQISHTHCIYQHKWRTQAAWVIRAEDV